MKRFADAMASTYRLQISSPGCPLDQPGSVRAMATSVSVTSAASDRGHGSLPADEGHHVGDDDHLLVMRAARRMAIVQPEEKARGRLGAPPELVKRHPFAIQ